MKYNYSLVLMCLMCIGIIQARIYNIDNSFLKSSPPSLAFGNTSYNSGLDTDFINKKTSIKTAIPITGSKNKIVSIDPIIPGDAGNFITTWEVKAGDLTITIPTSGSGYNYNIYWSEVGNPSNQNTISNSTGDQTITFPSAGTYKVEINGDFPQFYINNYADRDKILSVEQWGTIVWRSMQSAFYGASNLNVTATDRPNLSQVTDMSSMFAASSFNSPVNNWDVSNVTNIASLFNAAFAFNQSLNNWNVSKVTDMHALFSYALAFNQDISSWDVSKVTSMYGMFFGAGAFNQNISNWNVSQVTNMGLMFNEAISFNQNLGNWNVSAVSFMNVMLDDAALSTANYDKTLAGWATQNLKTNVSLGALGLHYCSSETARQSIIDNYGWSITRDSKDCTNNVPTDISLSNNSINQSAGLNAIVGTLTSTDADVGDTHTYSLVAGIGDNDNASFNISGTILRANNTSTMCNSTYNIRIRTTDGYNGSYEKTFIVTVIDDVAPVPSIANLPNIEMECAVKISDIPVPVATDPCTGTVNGTTTDPLDYNTIGTYTITWNYVDNSNNTSTQTQTVIVKPSTLAQVTFDDVSVTYNGTEQSIVVANLPTGATVSYTIILPTETVSGNSAINAGTYPVTATITPPPTEINCNPIELNATLTILKADLTGVDFEGAHFVYDGMSHSLLATDIPTGATVIYTNNSKIEAGTYEVTVLISLPNYNDLELTATLIIDKAVAIITADDLQKYVYDGTVKNAVASLNNPEALLVYTPQQGYIDAGTYPIEISAAETTDYLAVSKTISLIIEKADLTGIVFNGANFTYDGTPHSLAASGLPTGATVVYTNNNQTQAGTYEVTALVTLANYNDLELTATLIIDKAVATITADNIQTYVYDGTVKNAAASLNNPEGLLVYTPQQGYIDAGTYPIEISASETTDYLAVSKTISLVIQKADLTGVVFNGANFTYDGTLHSLAANGLPTGATVVYTNNNQTQAGTYEVTALISLANYNDLELTATLIIDKAVAIITADNIQTYVYDGTVKNAAASLNNPEGILVYTPQQGYINAGTYPIEISTTETPNYLAVSKTISLVIQKADLTGIVFNGANFTYDGMPHSLAASGLPTGAAVVYTNNNQTQAGTYEVTALVTLANYNDLELTATLIIDKAVAIITADNIQTYVYDGTVKNAAASLNNSEGVLVYMPQQGYINTGTYPIEISVAETPNYLAVSKTISLVIQKADLTGIVFNGANFTYDGMPHSLAANGLPTGATVVYTNNNQTQAGTYQVTALVTLANYNDLELTATLIIDKANQFITFDPIPVKNFSNGTTFQLNATASSGENVYYTYSYSTQNPAATVTPAGLVMLLTPGSILITAHQDGNQNYNPAETVEQELIITSSDNSIREIIINNRVYKNPDSELNYLIDCNDNTDIVNIQVKTEIGNQVSPGLNFTIQTPRPGIYRQKIIVTAPDGSTRDYEIIIEKRFDFEDIVVSKFDNVLLVNNNPQTNGGFEFIAYEWYKNGNLISTEQYYSAGDNSSDHLGSKSVYTVRVKTKIGIWLTTCEIEISQKRSYSVKLVPNPVYSGTVLKVISDFPTEELKDLKISIYDLTGRLILEKPSNQNSTEIIIPSGLTPAVYVLRFDTGRTVKALKFLVH